MSIAVPFDTLAFVKRLEASGVPSAQAEAQAEALSDAFQKVEESRLQDLATRGDLEAVKAEMIKWTAGMFVAQTALIIGAMFAVMKMNQPSVQPAVYQPPVQEMRQTLPTPSAPLVPAPPAPSR